MELHMPSRYTINEVFYSVPCAYARKPFSETSLFPCRHTRAKCFLNPLFALRVCARSVFPQPHFGLVGMRAKHCFQSFCFHHTILGTKKQARTGFPFRFGLADRLGQGLRFGSCYSPRFFFISSRERCAASSFSFRSITSCAWLPRLNSSLSFSFMRRFVRTALFFPLRMRPP